MTLFSDPMVDALTDLTDSSHEKQTYTCYDHESNKTVHGEVDYGSHIPIGSTLAAEGY